MSALAIDLLNLEAIGAIPSAATIDLENAVGDLIDISGTVTITRILLYSGHERTVRFQGAVTLTNSATLVLPGGADITTAAGDFLVFRGYVSGIVRCVVYTTAAASGAGDVVGPASATTNVPVLFNGTTGKIVKNSTPSGTGNPLLDTGPTMTAPVLGAASATSVANGAGAVGTPAYTFTGQTDLGLYKVSASQLGIVSGGALVATADGSGLTANSLRNRVNLGSTPVGTVSIAEYGDGRDITTVLTLTNFIVGALAGAAAALGVGNIVYVFPAGQHFEVFYSFSAISLTAAGTAVAGAKLGLGSVIASGAVSVLTGTTTFQDRLAGVTVPTASGGGAATSALALPGAGIGIGIGANVAASVKNVFLNAAATWNANNSANLTASGTIVLRWTLMS